MQTIDITTTQNVTIEYELAGLRERFFSLLIDSLIMLFLYIGLIFIAFSLTNIGENRFLGQVIGTFPFWFLIIYYLMCETFLDGQTIGKRTQRIKVVRVDGKPTSFSDLLLRSVLLLADYLFSGGILGAILISTTDKKQRLGDMAAGTTVIKVGTDRRFGLKDILNINTLDNYTPQYPDVKQLSEEDMLFIKTVLMRYQQYPNAAHSEAIDALFTHLTTLLDLKINLPYTNQRIEFLKGLIKDYIVLTR